MANDNAAPKPAWGDSVNYLGGLTALAGIPLFETIFSFVAQVEPNSPESVVVHACLIIGSFWLAGVVIKQNVELRKAYWHSQAAALPRVPAATTTPPTP